MSKAGLACRTEVTQTSRATASPGRDAMTALFMSPSMVPHVVLGIAFLHFFTQIGLSGTFLGLVLSHVIVILPVRMLLYIQDNIDPLIAAVCACLIALTAVPLIALDRLFGLDRLFVGTGRG